MVILSTALPARADVGMQIVINGSTVFNGTSTGAAINTTTPFTVDGITIQTSTGTSNTPGTGALATTAGSTVALESAATSAAGTVTVLYSSNSFTAPSVGPLTLASQLGGAVNTVLGPAGTLTFQSWETPGNTLFNLAGPTTGPQTANLTNTGAFVTSPNPATLALGSLTTPYTLTSRVIVALGLQGGTAGQLNWSGNANIIPGNVIPEPASIVMISTGLPLLGLGAWLRKRGNKV